MLVFPRATQDCYGDDAVASPKWPAFGRVGRRALKAPQLRLVKGNREKTMAKKERTFEEVKSDLPPVWEPKDGDTLEGVYVGFKDIKFRQKPFRTYQVQDEENGTVLSFSGAIADTKMMRIPRGAYIRVTYLGMTDTSNGEAKDFKVECDSKTKLLDEMAAQ
jgi:hypothetical protein